MKILDGHMISHKNEYQNKKYSELNATKVSCYSFQTIKQLNDGPNNLSKNLSGLCVGA